MCAAHLEYIEEPTQSAEDIGAFFTATGIPVALDESIDEGERTGSENKNNIIELIIERLCLLVAAACTPRLDSEG